MIFIVLSPIPQHANGSGEFGIAGRNRPSLTVGAEILAGIKAKACQIADAAYPTSLVFGSVCLSRILNHNQPVPPRHLQNRIHVCRLAVQMHWQDRPGASRNRPLDCSWINRERRWINIDEYGFGSNIGDSSYA